MKFRFTNHAQYRILERKISIENIKSVINKPDLSEVLPNDKIKCRRSFDGKTLVVVYLKSREDVIVLTAYYI
ncbi:MAG: DUF4258 domain-containing protein [bacterium]|nr:DUF4258 domain-containing protein [bacterium]